MLYEIFELFWQRLDFFYDLIIQHLFLSLLSILIATFFGLLLAILIFAYKPIRSFVLGLTSFIYVIPSISLLGLLIPFSGIGDLSALIALSLYALLPMIRTSYTAIASTDKRLIKAAKALGTGFWARLFLLRLPLALEPIVAAIKTMSVMTISLAGIAAFIGAGGLGVAIYRGISTNNQALIILGSLLIALLAIFFELFIALLQSLVRAKRVLFAFLLALLLSAFIIFAKFSHHSNATIKIATKPMSEQFIIAHILKALIEQDLGVEVALSLGIGGGTLNIHPAILKGEFDIYPEYTGTAWSAVLKKDTPYQDGHYQQLKSEYESKFKLNLLSLLGFNNTFSLATSSDLAKRYKIKTFSDLARVSGVLSFGAEPDFFERLDGYAGLRDSYGISFKQLKELDIGLKYNALLAGEVDVINTFTTDARLSLANITPLIDDLGFYPSYKAVLVVRDESLKAHKGLKRSLLKLQNLIDNKTMSELNAKVEIQKRSAKDVAVEFLKQKGLLYD